jgi:beta-mannosidase
LQIRLRTISSFFVIILRLAWCGNNEDYLFAELFHTSYDIKDPNPEDWLKTTFPARFMYEKMLPEICGRLAPDTPYHSGSPRGGQYFNDPTAGDTHMWEGDLPPICE